MDYIHQEILGSDAKTFLEVGCGASGWLPYFASKYRLLVSGLDYSEVGCRLAEENLRMQGIQFGNIFYNDLFSENCTNGKTYDIIFTYGVIEHFVRPQQVIHALARLLNPGGLIITLVPNLNGMMGLLSRIFVKDVFEMHKVINKAKLLSYHTCNGLKNLKTGYVGMISVGVIPWEKSSVALFKPDSWLRWFSLKVVRMIEFLAEAFCKRFPFQIPTPFFSPYIITIAQK